MANRSRPIKFTIYLSSSENEKLTEKANKAGLSKAAFLRKQIDDCVIKEAPNADIPILIRDIRRVGTNVNQLLKYDVLKHPNVAFTTDGGAPPYEHGKDTRSVGFFRLDEAALENAAEPEWFGEAEFELLSEEELYEEIEQEETQHEKK